MAITNEDGLIAALANPSTNQRLNGSKQSFTTSGSSFFSTLDVPGQPGAGSLTIGNTTTGLVPDHTLAGAPTINAFTGANTGYIAGGSVCGGTTGTWFLYDRLFHVGSINLNTLATTTLSSQPSFSSRLPGTDYTQVELWLEVNAAVSATATTVTVSYTNEIGTTGRTATLDITLSGATTRRLLPFRLQAGDRGIQRIDSITVGGTVATSGTFNVVIARKLAYWNTAAPSYADPAQDPFQIKLPQIYATSCLWYTVIASTTASGFVQTSLNIING